MENGNNTPPIGGRFNTLAQLKTNMYKSETKIVSGLGVDLANKAQLEGFAKRKMLSQVLSLELVDIAKAKKNKKMEQKFWNTYHCLDKPVIADGRMHGKYCKNRICTLCASIRKAELILKYYPVILEWPAPHFVTITCKAVPIKRLNDLIENLNDAIRKIIGKYDKRHRRGNGKRLIGIKSFECNFNPIARTYNPHYHLIVPDKETGEIFIKEWLERPRRKKRKVDTVWTTIDAQHIRDASDIEKTLIETIKYATKVSSKMDVMEKNQRHSKRYLFVRALYNILEAFDGLRIFEHFGFKVPKQQITISVSKVISDFQNYQYDLRKTDWVEEVTDMTLTDYVPDEWLMNMLRGHINRTLE